MSFCNRGRIKFHRLHFHKLLVFDGKDEDLIRLEAKPNDIHNRTITNPQSIAILIHTHKVDGARNFRWCHRLRRHKVSHVLKRAAHFPHGRKNSMPALIAQRIRLGLMSAQAGSAVHAQVLCTRLMPQATSSAKIWFGSHRLQDSPDSHRLTHDGLLSEERSPTEANRLTHRSATSNPSVPHGPTNPSIPIFDLSNMGKSGTQSRSYPRHSNRACEPFFCSTTLRLSVCRYVALCADLENRPHDS